MVTWTVQNNSDIIHDIEMTCERVVFLQKGYILCMISHYAITLTVKENPFLNDQRVRRT